MHTCCSSNVISLSDLTVDRKYPIEVAKHVTTRFGDTILLSLRDGEQRLVKVFLPKRYSEAFTAETLKASDKGTLFLQLIFKGKCTQSESYLLEIE